MISQEKLKDAERIVRAFMIFILLAAGISKLFSDGGFVDYYSGLFQGDLRINLPPQLVKIYLHAIPFIEIGLALSLIISRLRNIAVYGWFIFMASLLFGHYVLQEWSSVNQMLGYVFLGLICFILPHHRTLLSR